LYFPSPFPRDAQRVTFVSNTIRRVKGSDGMQYDGVFSGRMFGFLIRPPIDSDWYLSISALKRFLI
jgi:hypothetical protein